MCHRANLVLFRRNKTRWEVCCTTNCNCSGNCRRKYPLNNMCHRANLVLFRNDTRDRCSTNCKYSGNCCRKCPLNNMCHRANLRRPSLMLLPRIGTAIRLAATSWYFLCNIRTRRETRRLDSHIYHKSLLSPLNWSTYMQYYEKVHKEWGGLPWISDWVRFLLLSFNYFAAQLFAEKILWEDLYFDFWWYSDLRSTLIRAWYLNFRTLAGSTYSSIQKRIISSSFSVCYMSTHHQQCLLYDF